jgi:hypothetical protein
MKKNFKITLQDIKNKNTIIEHFETEVSDLTLARVKAINHCRLMRGKNGWIGKKYKSDIQLIEG